MNKKNDIKIFMDKKLLGNYSDYLFEYDIHENKFILSSKFCSDFECDEVFVDSIELFLETFMSEPVEENIYKVFLGNGRIKYIEVKIVGSPNSGTYYGFINDVTKRKLYEEELRMFAFYDALTGIPNRRQLISELEAAIKNSKKCDVSGAFVFIDLDGFKGINDRFGHKCGDEVLVKVSERINKILPTNFQLGRLGGDEFAIIVPNMETVDVSMLCEHLCDEVSAAADFLKMKTSMSASIGVSFFPDHSSEINGIVDLADRAMYISKSKGKNTFTFWNEFASYGVHN